MKVILEEVERVNAAEDEVYGDEDPNEPGGKGEIDAEKLEKKTQESNKRLKQKLEDKKLSKAVKILRGQSLGYLSRHLLGDWGGLWNNDKQENDFSVKNGFRILSAYNTTLGRLWIITEADRSATTFLLPNEY